MKLSIITVNLNNAIGLQKTIDSVLAQTWSDFEFIIIDGASTDGSKELIERLAISDKRLVKLKNIDNESADLLTHQLTNSPALQLKWISEPDTGIFNAMNKGIKMASGEYLLFLNSGDFLYSKTVLEEIFANKSYEQDFICAKCAVSNNGVVEFITNPPQEFTFSNFFGTTLAHQSTLIKRCLFEEYGLYREDLKLKSDWEFFVRTIILNKCSTKVVDLILVDYNLDGVSSIADNRVIQNAEMNKIFEETILCKFVPDYIDNSERLSEMSVYFWAKDKIWINSFVVFFYNLATFVSKLKKKRR